MLILLHFCAAAAYLAAMRFGARWLAGGVVLHGASLGGQYLQQPRFDVAVAFSSFMLMTMILGGFILRGQTARRLLAGGGAAAVFAPLFFAVDKPFPGDGWLHLLLAMGAYSLSLITLLQLLELRAAEYACRRLPAATATPLLSLEKKCFTALSWAFVLITLTLLSGGWQALSTGGEIAVTHKIIFPALTWLTFLILIGGRRFYGWRGQTAQWWLSAGFVFLLLSYFGHFVLQFLLGRV